MQQYSSIILFALAGIVGAWSRYAILWFLSIYATETLAWGVFIVNILGCFGFGLLWSMVRSRRILLVGFMASFTTFSSYIFEAYLFIAAEQWRLLFSNSLLQILLGLLALRLGLFVYASGHRKIC